MFVITYVCDICGEEIGEDNVIGSNGCHYHSECITEEMKDKDFINIGSKMKAEEKINLLVLYGFDNDEINEILVKALEENPERLEQAKKDFLLDYADEIAEEALKEGVI